MSSAPAVLAMLAGLRAEQPAAIEVSWTAPEPCPTAAEVRAQLERAVQSDPAIGERSPARGVATVERGADGLFHLSLRIETTAGSELFEAPAERCEALARVAVLRVLLASYRIEESLPARSPAEQEVQSPRPPPARPRVSVGIRASGHGGFGVLPGLSGGVALDAALTRGLLRVEVGAGFWPDRLQRVEAEPGFGGRFRLWHGAVRGCVEPRAGRVTFPLCLGVLAGAMRGEGAFVPEPRVSHKGWVALAAGPALTVRLGRYVAPYFGLAGLVSVLRPRFSIERYGEVYRVGPVGLWANAGLEVFFL